MELYYIEIKRYFFGENGKEYQMADGGEMPRLYRNKHLAIQDAGKLTNFFVDFQGYNISISNKENPAKKDSCLYATRLKSARNDVRLEIRVYVVYPS